MSYYCFVVHDKGILFITRGLSCEGKMSARKKGKKENKKKKETKKNN